MLESSLAMMLVQQLSQSPFSKQKTLISIKAIVIETKFTEKESEHDNAPSD